MAATTALLRLLVILLGISYLVCLNAVPITRLGRIIHGPQGLPFLEATHLVAEEKGLEEHVHLEGRMDIELNDYPGSGANHRHTPWPPQPRCSDC